MKENYGLTDESWSFGSYPRKEYKKNVLYTFYQYKDFSFLYNLNTGEMTWKDDCIGRLQERGRIDAAEYAEYEKQLCSFLKKIEAYDEAPIERIYDEIWKLRLNAAGFERLEEDRSLRMQIREIPDASCGIDQNKKKEELMAQSTAVIFALCQPEYFSLCRQDMEEAKQKGCRIYVLVSDQKGKVLPTQMVMERELPGEKLSFLVTKGEDAGADLSGAEVQPELEAAIALGKASLFFYGEEGLLQCKNLRVDSMVFAEPTGFYTKAVVNQLSGSRFNAVYIPSHFNVLPLVPLTEKTILSYQQLYLLWKEHGDQIYRYSAQQLYQKYPGFFMSVYELPSSDPETEGGYPLQITREQNAAETENWLGSYYELREKTIQNYLNEQEGLSYLSAYFDPALKRAQIPWGCSEQQAGILVEGIRMESASRSRVLFAPPGGSLHHTEEILKEKDPSLQLFSNFLFFMTPKLEALYNGLRKDRPREQYRFGEEHVDFKLYQKDGKRTETFPLYRKSCVAMKKSGQFLFFRFRLGGGTLRFGGEYYSWNAEDVDKRPEEEAPIQIYTPYGSLDEEIQKMAEYKKEVGSGRLNLIFIQEKVICIRKGSVLLPSTGVVVSLDAVQEERFLKHTGCRLLENGYYDCSGLCPEIRLDPPDQISRRDWEQIEWAYGGGLSLILEGEGLCDGGDPEQWLREEGWMSPLSRQTQESEVHKMEKHPRTAVGITREGQLVVLVFSGRIRMSVGADYREMCEIARQLFPDIRHMMNVDGGGSAMLGMALENRFMELSYPSPSLDSCSGMVRPIRTILCLRQ